MSELTTGEFRMVPIEQLIESPRNPRVHFGKLDELTESVRQQGVIQPLLVRPIGAGDQYEIAAGHRRYRAACAAGLERVPAVIQEMDDGRFLEVLMFENLNRQDLHELEEAAGYQVLMRELGYDVEDIVQKLGKGDGRGKSASYVYQRLKLLDLTEECQQAFLGGEMTAGHAILIARRNAEEQADCLWYLRPKEWDPQRNVSVRQLAQWIHSRFECDLSVAPFPLADVALALDAGSCMSCPKRGANDPTRDSQDDDLCPDGECYGRKVRAWQHLQAEEAEKARKSEPKEAAAEREAEEARQRAEREKERADAEQAAIARLELHRKERDARAAILAAILKAVKWPLGRKTIEVALAAWIGPTVCKRHSELDVPIDRLPAALAKLTEQELARVLVEDLLLDEAEPGEWNLERVPERLNQIARIYGIDAAKIRRELERPKRAKAVAKKVAPAKKAKKAKKVPGKK